MDDNIQQEEIQPDVDSMSVSELDTLIDSFTDTTEEAPFIEDTVEETAEDTTEEVIEEPVVDTTPNMDSLYKDLFVDGIKANGTNRVIKDVDHLKTLIQIGMGANETNRVVKPYIKQLKSLEQAGIDLNDNNTLNFVVDLMSGDKGAISKLIKDKGIEEEFVSSVYDEDTTIEYNAKDHVMSESRFTIEGIIDSTKGTEYFDDTIGLIEGLDRAGREYLSQSPNILKHVVQDMKQGLYKRAMDEAHYRREMGAITEQSDLLAYIRVMEDDTFRSSLFNVGTSKPPVKGSDIKKRKKRATNTSSTNTRARSSKKPVELDIGGMSVEELDIFLATAGY